MDKVIIFTRPDGGVSICRPVGRSIDACLKNDIPKDAINAQIVDLSDVPADRTFRGSWKQSGGSVQVDMPKAREIHMERIRKARDSKFEALDREWMKLTGQKKAREADEVEAKRQKLRNIPQVTNLETAKTPEELKAMWPEELNEI